MDGRGGGCCIARYVAGGGTYDPKINMERTMLKFRPIAPKPTSGGSVFGSASSSENNSNKTSSGETTYVKAGRGKRKYNAASGIKRSYGGGRKRVRALPQPMKRVDDIGKGESSGDTVMTLPLLPESPTEKIPTSKSTPIWLSFNSAAASTTVVEKYNNKNFISMRGGQSNHTQAGHHGKRAVVGGGRYSLGPAVVSGVTVECVTDTWVSGDGLGGTDEERVRNLEWDTCPGFMSDGFNRVTWTNEAYRKMVVGEGGGGGREVVVWVAMKERVPVNYPAFTCRVRVQHTCAKEVQILPCDVWRMDGGGFAWRLDVEAALSLGR